MFREVVVPFEKGVVLLLRLLARIQDRHQVAPSLPQLLELLELPLIILPSAAEDKRVRRADPICPGDRSGDAVPQLNYF